MKKKVRVGKKFLEMLSRKIENVKHEDVDVLSYLIDDIIRDIRLEIERQEEK